MPPSLKINNQKNLRGRDCKYRESLARLKKIENSDNLPGKPFQGDIFKKIISKFENSNVSEEMGKNEKFGFLPT